MPTNLSLATLQIPDEMVPKEIVMADLPDNWQKYPALSKLAESGSNWAKTKESLLLRVPSVVVEYEFNILINPLHLDMKYVAILQVDKRLFRGL